MLDRLAVRELIENWLIWRDAGDWERFRTLWHEDGVMVATWFQGPAQDFIAASKRGRERGVQILHTLGGSSIDLKGTRAIAQTRMAIMQRAEVPSTSGAAVVCDVTCTGRFYDFLEKRAGRWGIVLRQPIYEQDRMDPLDPGARLELDQALLSRLPSGYRHLAYLQLKAGFSVKQDQPQLAGPELDRLYTRGQEWLAGAQLQRS
jgi:hypothetical protein